MFLLQSLAGRKPTPPTLRYLRRLVLVLSIKSIFSINPTFNNEKVGFNFYVFFSVSSEQE
ncbi:hypothetical protein FDUTEX481_02638 [Tolypothrix sp. PCC 7601]|nr:hypothetical protein FDUTEX481_02638 [Tolypothrix sp. PCC 7601]BAY93799.1 hypothetical protein NIES3275_58410 [Microchaete diplosiphon NIES-3275]